MEVLTATLVVGVVGLVIGCGLCVKQCQFRAVTLENTLARIDPGKCTGCGACAQKCPAKVISGGNVKIEVAVS